MVTLLAILSTWRLSSLLAEEEGPWNMFIHLRLRVTNKVFGPKGAACVWCMSMWIGLFLTIYLCSVQIILWNLFPIVWWGLSGGAILIHTILQRLVRR